MPCVFFLAILPFSSLQQFRSSAITLHLGSCPWNLRYFASLISTASLPRRNRDGGGLLRRWHPGELAGFPQQLQGFQFLSCARCHSCCGSSKHFGSRFCPYRFPKSVASQVPGWKRLWSADIFPLSLLEWWRYLVYCFRFSCEILLQIFMWNATSGFHVKVLWYP